MRGLIDADASTCDREAGARGAESPDSVLVPISGRCCCGKLRHAVQLSADKTTGLVRARRESGSHGQSLHCSTAAVAASRTPGCRR